MFKIVATFISAIVGATSYRFITSLMNRRLDKNESNKGLYQTTWDPMTNEISTRLTLARMKQKKIRAKFSF